jgi:protein phosphatase
MMMSKNVDAERFRDLLSGAAGVQKQGGAGLFKVEGKLVILSERCHVVVVGDIHGDLTSLRSILDDSRFEQRVESGEPVVLLCLGDYIDRGPMQIEVLACLLNLLRLHPGRIVLLRGNHEGPRGVLVQPHDFPTHLESRFGESWEHIYDEVSNFFDLLYTAAIAPGKLLFLHGCVPPGIASVSDLASAGSDPSIIDVLKDALWSDPGYEGGVKPSSRGVGWLVGSDVIASTLNKLGVKYQVRSHESMYSGFSLRDRTITLFSCRLPEYGNRNISYMDVDLDDFHNGIERNIKIM